MAAVPLPTLFGKALSSASKAFNLPTAEQSTQDLLQTALNDLTTLNARVTGFSLFSPNELLDDISTRDLVYLLVTYVCAEVQSRIRTVDKDERIVSIAQAQRYLRSFLTTLTNYEIIPEEERTLHEKQASSVADPAKRRELKIKQYQAEKALQARIEVVRKRRRQLPVEDSSFSNFSLISSLLPLSSSQSATLDEDEEDSATDDILREATLLLLRLTYAQAHAHLESMDQELELLRTAPSPSLSTEPPPHDHRGKSRESDNMWKLDSPMPSGQGPLLDPQGKPLRPFTILPAGAMDRARLQSQVFGPSHRLPTMSIDEYLRIERERGNVIFGGGAQSAAEPTSSEQLALDAEMEGTTAGEEKAEEKRLKDERWARYTDENPKGAGNTMNRG